MINKHESLFYSENLYYGKIRKYSNVTELENIGGKVSILCDGTILYDAVIFATPNDIYDVNNPTVILNKVQKDGEVSELPRVSQDNSVYEVDVDALVKLEDAVKEQEIKIKGR